MTAQRTPRLTVALTVALIVASVRQGRLADVLVPWLEKRLAEVPWLELEVIDLAADPLDPRMHEPSPIASRLAWADAFVVLTPEYNHGAPGPLKTAIDAHRDEWARKVQRVVMARQLLAGKGANT